MNQNLARSIEIIDGVCTHFAQSVRGLVPWAEGEEDGARVAARLEGAAELLACAAAELKKAREGG